MLKMTNLAGRRDEQGALRQHQSRGSEASRAVCKVLMLDWGRQWQERPGEGDRSERNVGQGWILFLLCCVLITGHMIDPQQLSAELNAVSVKTDGRGRHGEWWFQGSSFGKCYLRLRKTTGSHVQNRDGAHHPQQLTWKLEVTVRPRCTRDSRHPEIAAGHVMRSQAHLNWALRERGTSVGLGLWS